MDPEGVPDPVDREVSRTLARAGIRRWITRTGQALRHMAPVAILTSMTAAALAPIILPAFSVNEGLVGAQLFQQLGNLGAGYLTGVIQQWSDQLSERGDSDRPDEETLREMLRACLEAELSGPRMAEARAAITALVQAVDGVSEMLAATRNGPTPDLAVRIVEAVNELSFTATEFRELRDDLLASLEGIQRDTASIRVTTQNTHAEVRRMTIEVAMLRRLVVRSPGPGLVRPVDASGNETGTAGDHALPAADEVSPYPGLAPYEVRDADRFFGRDQLVATVMSELSERVYRGTPLIVTGASGAGKSSVLRAGVIPELTSGAITVPGSRDWPYVVMTPGAFPLRHLAVEFAFRAGVTSSQVADQLAKAPKNAHFTVRDVLRARPEWDPDANQRLVLVIDQFEEAFTECRDDKERKAFIDAICAMATGDRHDPPLALVVIGMHTSFVEHCTAHPELAPSLENPVIVGPMNKAELRDAIESPARLFGLSVESGLTETMLNDIEAVESLDDSGAAADERGKLLTYEPGKLPLLAHALYETWKQREGNQLTTAAYQAAGGVHRAIAETAERVYSELERDGHEAVARRLLLSLTRPDAAGDTRRSVERTALLHQLPAEDALVADNLLARLEKERLLTEDDGKVQISHEALLRHWPRLAGWLAEDRDWLRERQLLAEQAQQWEEGGYLPDLLLLRGNVLDEIRKQLDADRLADLGEPTRQYVQAADKRERRAKQTRRSVLVTLVALIVLAGGFAFAALHDSMRANQLQTVAQVGQLLAVAGQLRASDPQISLLLDLEAYRMQQTSETGDALLSAQTNFFTSVIRAQVGAANAVAYSPSGALVAVAGSQDALTVWDPVDDEIVARFRGSSAFYAVAFAPGGQLLAGGEQNGEIAVWNMATRRQVASLDTASAGSGAAVNSIAFEPRGHVLAAAGDTGGIVQLWDTRTWRSLASLPACATVNSLAISPDGAQLAAACSDQNVLVWQMAHLGTAPRTLAGHTGVMQAVAFSPDSGTLAAATDNGTIMLWVASTGSLKSVLRGSSAKVYALTFRLDGALLASGGADGVVRLWDMGTFAQAYALAGPSQRVNGLAFSPDGHTIASADADATVGFWSVPAPPPPGVQPPATAVSAAAGGTTIAASGPRLTVKLWNSAQSSGPASLTLPGGQSAGTTTLSLALSPDGAELAAAPPGNQVDLWTTQGRRAPLTLSSPNPVTSVSVNHATAGAVTVAAGSSAGYVYLWNIPSSRRVTPAAAQWTSIPDCLRAQVSTVALSTNSQLMAAGCTDGTLTLASQSSTGRWTTTEPSGGPQKAVTAIAFSPNGKLFATGAQDGSVELWDASHPGNPEKLATLPGPSEQVISIAFSSDGKLAISAADDSISLWDVTTPGAPSPLAVLSGLASPTSVAWQPRTQILVGTAADGTPLAWNTDPADIAAEICRESALPGNAKRLISPVMNGIAYQAVCP